jgi:hypothetical protein
VTARVKSTVSMRSLMILISLTLLGIPAHAKVVHRPSSFECTYTKGTVYDFKDGRWMDGPVDLTSTFSVFEINRKDKTAKVVSGKSVTLATFTESPDIFTLAFENDFFRQISVSIYYKFDGGSKPFVETALVPPPPVLQIAAATTSLGACVASFAQK